MVQIRVLTKSDLAVVTAMDAHTGNEPWSLRQWEEAICRGDTFCLAAFRSSRMLGFAVSRIVCDELQIEKIAVSHGAKRQGIATRMMAAHEEIGVSQSCRYSVLETRNSNRAALALYRGCGYEVTQKRPGLYGSPQEDGVAMKKDLETTLCSSLS